MICLSTVTPMHIENKLKYMPFVTMTGFSLWEWFYSSLLIRDSLFLMPLKPSGAGKALCCFLPLCFNAFRLIPTP